MKIEREVFVKESKAAIANANERLNKRMKDCDRQLTTLFPPLHPARKDNRLKFEDMISLLQEERASVLAKVKSLEEETEAAQDESAILEQQVHILSKEVSKYKRQNKEIIRALKEVNVGRSEKSDIPMDEVAVDTQVEQRLGKLKQFMHDRLLE
jgi:chromosome segregation ATPase